jgi:hypothetical protein
VENNNNDDLFGFSREDLAEAMQQFQKMNQKEAKDFLRNHPLAKIIMHDFLSGDLSGIKKQDD